MKALVLDTKIIVAVILEMMLTFGSKLSLTISITATLVESRPVIGSIFKST
jgi:hypothetical protein